MRPKSGSARSIVTFHRIFSAAPPPLRGDKSALGTLPAAAFQYCEPVRTASSFGWHIFPPIDIRLKWNGVDVYYGRDSKWIELKSILLTDEFADYWDENAPEDLKGCSPPFMTATFAPGVVQIWSGLLVSTADGWGVVIGAAPNRPQTRHFSCFEGLVETDVFRPCPLFINVKLHTTDKEILIPRNKPLFFVRPILRECYAEQTLQFAEYEGLAPRTTDVGSMSEEDWVGYRRTVRKIDAPSDEYRPGRLGVERRRRSKRET